MPQPFLIGTMTGAMADTISSDPIVHKMNTTSGSSPAPFIIIGVLIVLGIGSGFFLTQRGGGVSSLTGKTVIQQPANGEVKSGQIYGSSDEKAFKDSAEGELQKGGLEGEGSHHLIRPGGDSQTVYLTSSTLDLNQFTGKKVKVWGQTYQAQKAGWFMDVGRVEVK